jgi:hypothetical protein
MDGQHGPEALRRSFGAARRLLRWVQWVLGGAVAVMLLALVIHFHWSFLLYAADGLLYVVLIVAMGAGTRAGVKVGASRARRAVRQLPDPEAIHLLQDLRDGPSQNDRLLAEELLKGLHPEGTEMIAAEAPAGRGSEAAAVEPPAAGS